MSVAAWRRRTGLTSSRNAVKLGGGGSELDPKVQAVLNGVPAERIISITHAFTPGLLTVLIVLRVDGIGTAA